MTIRTYLAATATAAFLAVPANAQMFGQEAGADLEYDQFQTGLGSSGYYDAWDADNDAGLSEREFATGMYADWDRNNDRQITEDEFAQGSDRWFGSDFGAAFNDWDADGDGVINQQDFGQNWDSDYYAQWDQNQDGLLDENEFSQGLYSTADLDQNQVITIEEEGWFEGWFDGDDIEAEIQDVGDVM
jgi:hypothetical protein